MQELINRLIEKTGISADQATKSLETIKDFVKEKFPMLGGAVDNMFAPAPPDTAAPINTAATESSMLDKISDVIPGQAGEKVEEFAKIATHKAEEVFDSVKDKVSGMFSGDKK